MSITRSNKSRSRYGFSPAACAVVALVGLIVPASSGAVEASKLFVPAKIEALREAEQRESNKVDDYPDPDLVVEVDISPPQVDREGIYATLKVPEVWLFDGQVLAIWRLRADGRYAQAESSEWLGIRADQAARWLIQEDRRDRKAWTTRLATWVRGGMTP